MTTSSPTASLTATPALCTTTLLPSHGILSISGKPSTVLTLDSDVIFKAPCPTAAVPTISVTMSSTVGDSSSDGSLNLSTSDGSGDGGGDDDDMGGQIPHFSDFRDPFFASSFPICYALASTTVTAYMLVIMLFITPRSFLDSGRVHLGRRGRFSNGSSANVNIGRRPWLQKVAALTVAISLTIATADTFKIAKDQYIWGVQNAKVLQNEVMGSTELKAIRLISDTFLWSAQAQTLIRLFPRQREKTIITWTAVALISLDVVFSALNSFIYSDPGNANRSMPKGFTHPVPALGYLFQLSLGVLYAAWVIYYALMKKRYAFYHPLMRNMCLVAGISLGAIMIPVVFFILDISKPEFTGWGDYVRWVGAAAASVVVWEWLERIEALEREEKKDGILGREVFDGDDTLEVTASEPPWRKNRKGRRGADGDGGGSGDVHVQDHAGIAAAAAAAAAGGHQDHSPTTGSGSPWSRCPAVDGGQAWNSNCHHSSGIEAGNRGQGLGATLSHPPGWLMRPAPVMTPMSRADTTSADSTIYHVRYQAGTPLTRTPLTRTPELPFELQHMADLSRQTSAPQTTPGTEAPPVAAGDSPLTNSQSGHVAFHVPQPAPDLLQRDSRVGEPGKSHWQTLVQATNPLFSRRGSETSSAPQPGDSPSRTNLLRAQTESRSRWDLLARFEEFAADQAERMRERLQPTADTNSLPVTVIPAPARRGAALLQVLEEEELGSSVASAIRRARRRSGPGGSDDHDDDDGESNSSGRSSSSISSSANDRDGSHGGGGAGSGDNPDLEAEGEGHERNVGAAAPASDANAPLARTSFPLWPGVRHRQMTYDDDVDDDDDGDAGYAESYEGSITESLSVVSQGHDVGADGDADAGAGAGAGAGPEPGIDLESQTHPHQSHARPPDSRCSEQPPGY